MYLLKKYHHRVTAFAPFFLRVWRHVFHTDLWKLVCFGQQKPRFTAKTISNMPTLSELDNAERMRRRKDGLYIKIKNMCFISLKCLMIIMGIWKIHFYSQIFMTQISKQKHWFSIEPLFSTSLASGSKWLNTLPMSESMWSAQTMCIFVEWTRVYCKQEHIFLNVCYFVLFSRMGACQCWHLPSFYLSSDESAYCFLGKYCLIRQSLAFKHCFFPTSHDPVRIEQRQFFFICNRPFV